MELYIELQKQFIDNYHKGIYPSMETTRLAFKAYWETLEVAARTVYKKLQDDYGRESEKKWWTVPDYIALDYIRTMYECSDECAKEILCVMTMGKTDYHEYITERQGGEIVL
jgi:hypothetical protein